MFSDLASHARRYGRVRALRLNLEPPVSHESFAPSRASVVLFVSALTLASILSFVHRFLPSVLIDAIRKDVAISDLQFGTLQTAFALTYVGATLLSGWFADRANRRNLIVGGVALWTLGSFAFAMASTYSGLFIARAMVGLGEAVLAPAGISLLCSYVEPRRRGLAIGAFYFGATLGTSVAFSGGGWLLGVFEAGALGSVPLLGVLTPWRQVVLLFALLGVALMPLLLAYREPPRLTSGALSAEQRVAELWTLRATIVLVLITGSSIAFADFSYTTWQTALLTRSFALEVSEAGQAIGAAALFAGVVGAWVGGWLSDRAHVRGGVVGRIGVIQGCAVGLLGASLLLLLPIAPAAIAAFAVWQVVANVAYVAVAVTMQDFVSDRTRALAASLQTCLSIGLGLGLGPYVVAAMNLSLGHGANALALSLLLLVGGMAVITLVASSVLRRRVRGAESK